MTELMKRYGAETGYTIKEAMKNHMTFHYWDRYFEWVGKLALSLLEENAQLKAQLRWRPVGEMPENDRWYTCYCPILDSSGAIYADDYAICYYDDGWCGSRSKDITHYFNAPFDEIPIPPAPEGEDI